MEYKKYQRYALSSFAPSENETNSMAPITSQPSFCESKAIKCVPYTVIFGQNAVLPQDILFDHNVPYQLTDATMPADKS